jgi:hypothetical protein
VPLRGPCSGPPGARSHQSAKNNITATATTTRHPHASRRAKEEPGSGGGLGPSGLQWVSPRRRSARARAEDTPALPAAYGRAASCSAVASACTMAAHRPATRRTIVRRPRRSATIRPAAPINLRWYVVAEDVTPALRASWPTQRGPVRRAISMRHLVGSATAAALARKSVGVIFGSIRMKGLSGACGEMRWATSAWEVPGNHAGRAPPAGPFSRVADRRPRSRVGRDCAGARASANTKDARERAPQFSQVETPARSPTIVNSRPAFSSNSS